MSDVEHCAFDHEQEGAASTLAKESIEEGLGRYEIFSASTMNLS
jgi:hypothetical protein